MLLMNFPGKVLVIGCGAVSQCALPLILKLIGAHPKKVTIMDPIDNRARVKDILDQGVQYVFERVVKENYKELLEKLGLEEQLKVKEAEQASKKKKE